MRLLFLLLSTLFALSCTKAENQSTKTVNKLEMKTVAIDVRSQAELETSPAPGAIHIPLSKIEGGHGLPEDKKTPILVFCEAGGRASSAKSILETKGYTNVKNIKDWRAWNKLQASNSQVSE